MENARGTQRKLLQKYIIRKNLQENAKNLFFFNFVKGKRLILGVKTSESHESRNTKENKKQKNVKQ